MNLRTYQAFTMAQALAAVKRDLGANAVILNTRTFRRWRFPALWKRTIVEVTATMPQPQAARQRPSSVKPAPITAGAARRAYAPAQTTKTPIAPAALDESPSSIEQDRLRTRRLAMAMVEQLNRQQAATPPEKSPEPSPAGASANGVVAMGVLTAAPPSVHAGRPLEIATANGSGGAAVQTLPAARRYILNEPGRPRSAASGDSAPKAVAVDGPSLAQARNMQDELSTIRSMVGQVLQRQAAAPGEGSPSSELPHQLLDIYLRLIGQDLSEDLADQVVRSVRAELNDEQLNDDGRVRASVLRQLARIIPVATDAAFEPNGSGRPVVIAMVGPTGVGKTTTLAKLAAAFKLQHNLRVGLITADTYRISAVEQLRTYANIIGLPLEVVLTPAEMREAIERLACGTGSSGRCDVILVDTAGRSQNDTGRIDDLREFMQAARPDQVHLVLSSTAGERVLLREAEAFSPLGIHRIVLTKLDEAVSFGMLINVIHKVGKQLSFVTTGQEVPEHLEAGRAERLAELVLGGPLHS